jgi:RluA family pseudouridine synthase
MAIDKPAGWLLVPPSWQRTQRNLQAAITSSIAAGDFWARKRNLRFLRHVHRLDGDTSGVLLFAKSPGAVDTYGDLFESRRMAKVYLAVVHGVPRERVWTCRAKLGPDPRAHGRVRIDPHHGKEAETSFRVLQTKGECSLVEARPLTGRTHQIRVHLLEAGHPVVGDALYGPEAEDVRRSESPTRQRFPLGLRAIRLSYRDPFVRRLVVIEAPTREFLRVYKFEPETEAGTVTDPRGS